MDTKTRQRKPGSSAGTPMRSCQAKSSHISLRVKLREALRRDGWGRLSDDGPGQYNPDPSECPWGRAGDRSKGGATKSKDQPTGWASWSQRTKSRGKPSGTKGMPGAGLTEVRRGKARFDRPALKPYWGKPAVRNFREGDGNVATGAELRPTPKDVERPSDPTARAPSFYSTICAFTARVPLPADVFSVGTQGPADKKGLVTKRKRPGHSPPHDLPFCAPVIPPSSSTDFPNLSHITQTYRPNQAKRRRMHIPQYR